MALFARAEGPKKRYVCVLCNLELGNVKSLKAHLRGKRHTEAAVVAGADASGQPPVQAFADAALAGMPRMSLRGGSGGTDSSAAAAEPPREAAGPPSVLDVAAAAAAAAEMAVMLATAPAEAPPPPRRRTQRTSDSGGGGGGGGGGGNGSGLSAELQASIAVSKRATAEKRALNKLKQQRAAFSVSRPAEAAAGATGPAAPAGAGAAARVASTNAARAPRFVKWLLRTYGAEALAAGAGVLDVAGGAGGVAFELCCRYGIPCTTVDPVPIKLSAKQRRVQAHRETIWADAHSGDAARAARWRHRFSATEERRGAPERPRQLRTLFGDAFCRGAAAAAAAAAAGAEADASGGSHGGDAVAAGSGSGSTPPGSGVAPGDEDTARLWRECSVVVGLHPDEATSPIVECARRHGKPFAVVPCCVYPKMFPERRTPDGRAVRTYSQFLEHLAGLGCETAEMDIPGRNIICFQEEPAVPPPPAGSSPGEEEGGGESSRAVSSEQ